MPHSARSLATVKVPHGSLNGFSRNAICQWKSPDETWYYLLDFILPVRRIPFPEYCQRSYYRCRAFGVVVFYHDVTYTKIVTYFDPSAGEEHRTKDLCRVYFLQPCRAADTLIASEATARVLQ